MGQHQKDWARRKRADWTLALGHQCARCRTYGEDGNWLTFDCIIPQGDTHHLTNADGRITFYRAQLKALNVQLLCESCNARKGADSTDYRRPEDMELARALAASLPEPKARRVPDPF